MMYRGANNNTRFSILVTKLSYFIGSIRRVKKFKYSQPIDIWFEGLPLNKKTLKEISKIHPTLGSGEN